MKKTVDIYYCDICKKEAETRHINYPVIFYTEQTEGRSCKPYIEQSKLDVCASCLGKVCRIDGVGAQGVNEYKIRGEIEQ